MRIRIDLKIFAFLLLFFLTKQIEIYAIIMFFCIIHEFGHVLMGIILGLKIDKITIMPLGLSVSFKLNTTDYNKRIKKGTLLDIKKIAIAIAGPLTNLIIILLSLCLKNINSNIIYANLLIFLFNLIPVYPLDGGRLLKSIVHIFCGYSNAIKYTNVISNTIIIIFSVICSIMILKIHNIAIVMILMYLWILVYRENKRYDLIKLFLENKV